jgi:hypothetical protein
MANPKGYTAPTGDRGKWLPVKSDVRLRKKFEEGPVDSCWPWLAGRFDDGYGKFWNGERSVPAHRAVYELLVDPIPEGLQIDHLCHNRDATCVGGPCVHRRCVNPAHLEPVSAALNKRRGKSPPSINALKTECPRGHPLDGANLITRRNGWRMCRVCTYESNRNGQLRRKGR